MTERASRRRWGDEDPDDEDYLPPSEETGPDENGVKVKVEYYRNEKGQTMRKSTRTRVVSVQKKVYKISQIRGQWPRFGAATGNTEGMTVVSNDEIQFENIRAKTKTLQQNRIEDIQKSLQSADNKTIVAEMDDLLKQRREERLKQRAMGLLPKPPEPPTEDGPKASNPDKYVPPRQRGETDDKYRRPGNENSVRVTNLSDDVDESDLADLFSPFGHISRIYLALDKETKRSRGFAFINFSRREEAERAINALNGYGYSNLIIHCEWAAPKERK